MYAIRLDDELLPDRYASWDEAVEYAQEHAGLAPEDPWEVVVLDSAGDYYRSPAYGV